ncbi:MAG: WD40 repeat domain-containing serine/threonine protein kinase [Vulcanimicrobiota bacterium]
MDPSETVDVTHNTLSVARLNSGGGPKPEIPGYKLGDRLGRGAFGEAYRATQLSTGQEVAVKVLVSVSGRFRDEVERLSQVSDHTHIVTLVDAQLDHDPPYLVTPLFSGSLLDEVPRQPSEADIEKVCSWLRQLAGALDYMHRRGILHCDVKPANVLLDREGNARLTDFGQATLRDQSELRLGSFWFMPWQQAEGGLPEVTWDLYALGATAYALLTGVPPCWSKQEQVELQALTGVAEQVKRYRQALERPVTPIRQLNPAVDPELACIVEYCLKLDQGYGSASEILSDLDRRDQKRPLAARPFSRGYWLERFVTRNRLSVAVGLIAVAVLLVGLSLSSYEVYKARQARQLLIEQRFEQGRSMIDNGQATGLVWLAEAYQLSGRSDYQLALRQALARQMQIADPSLYRLRTATAPSPSGRWAIWTNPANLQRVLVDLRDGSTGPLPANFFGAQREQKDRLRYRLDGIVLDPSLPSPVPGTWAMRSFDSAHPDQHGASLALHLAPTGALRAVRVDHGIQVQNAAGKVLVRAERPGKVPQSPVFSLQGELAVAWEDGQINLYTKAETKTIDTDFVAGFLCFSPDGQFLAGSGWDAPRVRVWTRQGAKVADFSISAPVTDMVFDQASQLVVCATRVGLVHGYSLIDQQPAWPPIELENPARWIYVQEGGQIVTMSDEVMVWKLPEPLNDSLVSAEELKREISRRTGWLYDEKARVRTLSRSEYLERYAPKTVKTAK